MSTRPALLAMVAALLLVFAKGEVVAQDAPGVLPIQSNPYGLTYGEWSALQWQWLFSLPVDQHPLFDTADCSTGQFSDHVWFLGGTFASIEVAPGVIVGEADRECTVPSGKALFFPLINVECSDIEGNGDTEEELRDCANFFADFIVAETVFLEVDGDAKDVSGHRAESPLFTIGPLPDNNVIELFGIDAPAGTTAKSVSDGYWAMLPPLSVGTHTVSFGGLVDLTAIGGPLFSQDIHYTIHVVPRGQ